MKTVYNNIIPFKGFEAINLFGVVFARKEYKPLDTISIHHEMIHTKQMKELGYIFFYLWYFAEWLVKLCLYGKKAYHNISLEREAYTNMYYSRYLDIRKKYSFLKYIRHEKD
jgi:hypothetical protein